MRPTICFHRIAIAISVAALCFAPVALQAQQGTAKSAYKAGKTRDGDPDLQGIWQVLGTAADGLDAHNAAWALRGGFSYVVNPADGKIPYKPEALAQKQANFAQRMEADPLGKCYLPGVPRVMYLPFPVQIFQTKNYIFIASEFAHTSRTIYMKRNTHYGDAAFWMGDSWGKWDGDTLVIDSANFNAQTWLDASGNHHGEMMHVVERLKRTSADTMEYEATIEDPETFTAPWTVRMTMHRDTRPNATLLEYECHVYLEDIGKK